MSNGLAKAFALQGIFPAGIEAGTNESRSPGSDGITPLLQSKHGYFESFPLLTHSISQWYTNITHGEKSGIASADSPLLLQCATGKPRHVAFYNKCAQPTVVPVLLFLQIGPAKD